MTHLRRLLALCLLALACVGAHADPPLPPKPTRWATDRAGYLREETRARLDAELKAYEQASQHQVILWIGDSLHGVPIEDFAARTMRAWGIGRKKERDGVVLFVFAKDRKLRIEVGYGLEDRLPDAIANRILQERVVPKLRAGDPDGGLKDGVHAILATLGGGPPGAEAQASEPQAGDAQPAPAPLEAGQEPPTSADPMGCLMACVFLAFFLTLLGIIIYKVRRRGGTTWGGGSSGGSSWDSGSDSGSSSSSSSDSDFSSGGGDSGGGGASGDW